MYFKREAITKLQAVIVALIVIVAIVAGTWYYYASLPVKKEIVIGGSVQLTGAQATEGTYLFRGYTLAVEDQNAKGGVLGMRIRLILEDDGSNPEACASIYERLITREKIDFAFLPFGSTHGFTASQICEKYGILSIGEGGSSGKIFSSGFKYTFHIHCDKYFGATWQVPILFMLAEMDKWPKEWIPPGEEPPKTIYFISMNNEYGRSAMDVQLQVFHELGLDQKLELLGHELYDPDATDYTPMLLRIKALNGGKGPDILVNTPYAIQAPLILQQCYEVGLHPKIYYTAGFGRPAIETIGLLAQDVVVSSVWPRIWDKESVAVRERAAQRFGGKPEDYEHYEFCWGYSAAQCLFKAIERAGSLDKDAIRHELVNVGIEDTLGWDFVKFNPAGYREGPASGVWQCQVDQYPKNIWKDIYPGFKEPLVYPKRWITGPLPGT